MATFKTPKYNAPQYDDKKYKKGVDTSYYDKAIKDYTAQANTDRKTQIGDARKAQQANLRNAYVNRLQNERNLNNNLVNQGIRGGATETSNLRLANMYGNAVSAANSDYANSVNQINRAVDQNIRDYRSDMLSRAEEYRQNMAQQRWQADRDTALAKWQAGREENTAIYNARKEKEAREWQAKREDRRYAVEDNRNEVARQTEYWSNYYINYYSGFKKKDLDNALKEAKKNRANAKTTYDKIRYEQQIAGIQARRGVINNK